MMQEAGSMRTRTLPVYSKLADEAEAPPEVAARLPLNPDGTRWRLSQHQVETYKALTSSEYDVIFNTAMTGDGKSLAAYLRTLVSGRPVLAMYPTNELARDQQTQLDGSKKRRQQRRGADEPGHLPLPGAVLLHAQRRCAGRHTDVYYRLSNKTIEDSYETARAHLKQTYWDVLGISTGRALNDYLELMKGARQIAEEAQSFRGGSPFECGVIDLSEAGADSVKRYGLLTLAANADLDWLEPDEFKGQVAQRGAAFSSTAIEQMAGWFRFRGFSEARRAVTILLRDAVGA
jgi:hypothetical protein